MYLIPARLRPLAYNLTAAREAREPRAYAGPHVHDHNTAMSWLNILLIYPTIAYTALTLALYALSCIPDPATSRITSYYGRTLAAFGTLILCAVYGMTVSVVLRLAGKGGLSQWSTARAFKWTMKYTSQVEFEIVQGEEHLMTRPAVFVGNHQTYVLTTIPCKKRTTPFEGLLPGSIRRRTLSGGELIQWLSGDALK